MASEPLIRLAVFGNPVTQSLSPRIHRMFAAQCGIAVDYRAIEATEESFPGLVAELAASGASGCNITAPFKHPAWKLSAWSSESAARARAANTLVFNPDGDWYADNTDGRGLVNDLESMGSGRLQGARVCLLGAGGAAAGVLGALLTARPASILIANRTLERARELAASHADLGAVDACLPAEIASAAPFDLIINATSLGHGGGAQELSPAWLEPGGLCYDMNYGNAARAMKNLCQNLGMDYSDGLGMLVGQAALSFGLWTGHAPDTAPVLRELRAFAR